MVIAAKLKVNCPATDSRKNNFSGWGTYPGGPASKRALRILTQAAEKGKNFARGRPRFFGRPFSATPATSIVAVEPALNRVAILVSLRILGPLRETLRREIPKPLTETRSRGGKQGGGGDLVRQGKRSFGSCAPAFGRCK